MLLSITYRCVFATSLSVLQCSRDTRDTPHVYSSGGLVKGRMYRIHRRRTLYCNGDEENKIARDLESFENYNDLTWQLRQG